MVLHIAAMQEVVDVPTERAPAIFAAMNRLAGIMLFLFRNDPSYRSAPSGALLYSVRPSAWREQMPIAGPFVGDRSKVGMPLEEVHTWREYFKLLWGSRMFLLGTKTGDMVYVPEHPTFEQFILHPPTSGWQARRIDSPELQPIAPNMVHVEQTDWTYMGFARLRLFWKSGTTLRELLDAYRDDDAFEQFLKQHLKKVLLENRSSATPPPGYEMNSLAFVSGLIENFDVVESLLGEKPYRFWQAVAQAAECQPLDSLVWDESIPELASRFVELSAVGLHGREKGEDRYLDPIRHMLHNTRRSHSESNLKVWQQGGLDGLLKTLLYGFDS